MAKKTKKQLIDAYLKAVSEEDKYRRLEKKHESNNLSIEAKITSIDRQIEKLNTKRNELNTKLFKEAQLSSHYSRKASEIMRGKREKARKAILQSSYAREIKEELKKQYPNRLF